MMTNDQDMTREGDIVLVHYQERPAVYGRIEAIEPDTKKDWYQVSLLLLTMPPQPVTWILREEYVNGTSFTMGGQSMRLERVKRVVIQRESHKGTQKTIDKRESDPTKVIPFKRQS